MGTEVQCKSYLPGYYSMRDLNEDSNNGSWPPYYSNGTFPNGQYCSGLFPRTVEDMYFGFDKDAVKRTMISHETMFRMQVSELHRLYRVQQKLMDEIRRNEQLDPQIPMGSLLSSTTMASPLPARDSCKWKFSFATPSASNADCAFDPSSIMKGSSVQASSMASQSGGFSENRPFKVRRKMFDLQLPADEYIDTEEEEEQADEKVSALSNSVQSNGKNALNLNGCLKRIKDLADLSNPTQVEEMGCYPASVDFLGRSACHTKFQNREASPKPMSRFLALPKEILHSGSDDGIMSSPLQVGRVKGKEWLYIHESGHNKSSHKPISPSLQQELLRPPAHSLATINSNHELSMHFPSNRYSGDCREKPFFGVENSERIHALCSDNHSEPPPMASQPNCSFSHMSRGNPPTVCAGWNQSMLGRTCLNSPAQTHGTMIYRDNGCLDNYSGLNPVHRSMPLNRNGFDHGSSSRSKEQPVCYNNAGIPKCFMGHGNVDLKPRKEMALNMMLSSSSSNGGAVPQRGTEVLNGGTIKHEGGHGTVLSWLTASPSGINEPGYAGRDPKTVTTVYRSSKESETGKGPGQGNGVIESVQKADSSAWKILGVPIFEKDDSFSFTSSPTSLLWSHEGEAMMCNKGKEEVPDMNVASDPAVSESGGRKVPDDLVCKEEGDSRAVSLGDRIDLNSCISEEEEASLAPSRAKLSDGINLEAPAYPEPNESVHPGEAFGVDERIEGPSESSGQLVDELVMAAAEAIVAFSSSAGEPEAAPLRNPLCWFVDVACSCWNDSPVLGGSRKEGSCSRAMDYFEFMTLRLSETGPGNPDPRTVATATATSVHDHSRKGQGRRGRQRRDFQRDILPGLVSLSRHEVTEDLQTLGGLMRALGHSWQLGPTRRAAARDGCWAMLGRRRSGGAASYLSGAVAWQQSGTGVGMGLEEGRLGGWGKTTRRARRRRCHPGSNPVLVHASKMHLM